MIINLIITHIHILYNNKHKFLKQNKLSDEFAYLPKLTLGFVTTVVSKKEQQTDQNFSGISSIRGTSRESSLQTSFVGKS